MAFWKEVDKVSVRLAFGWILAPENLIHPQLHTGPMTNWTQKLNGFPKQNWASQLNGAPLGPSTAFGGLCAIITMELHKPHLAF